MAGPIFVNPVHRMVKMRAAAFFLGFLTTVCLGAMNAAADGQADGRTWIFSGSELVAALRGDDAPETSDKELKRTISTARANAYIAGVADALQGREWCGGGKILPHELADRVFTHINGLSPEKRQENAAILVRQALSKEFPCGNGGTRKQ